MSAFDQFSFIRRVSQIGTLLQTHFCGQEVGRDASGNRYYKGKAAASDYAGTMREKRWVLYAGEPEASKVPPEWHIWLHHTANAPIPNSARRIWQKPHQENMTGTPDAWLPPALEGKDRPKATGDYQAWKPD